MTGRDRDVFLNLKGNKSNFVLMCCLYHIDIKIIKLKIPTTWAHNAWKWAHVNLCSWESILLDKGLSVAENTNKEVSKWGRIVKKCLLISRLIVFGKSVPKPSEKLCDMWLSTVPPQGMEAETFMYQLQSPTGWELRG